MTRRYAPISRCGLAALLAAAAVAGQAADPKPREAAKAAPAASKPAPLLTRDELRECMARRDRLRTQTDEVAKSQAEMQRDKAEIEQRGATLKAQLETLDRSSQAAIDAYNAQATERDRLMDAYEARIAPFNGRIDALATERDAYSKACENRRFDERDEIAIKNGK